MLLMRWLEVIRFVWSFVFWTVLSMLDKAVYWWHWGRWNSVWSQRGDIIGQGVVHGLAWCGLWMILEAGLDFCLGAARETRAVRLGRRGIRGVKIFVAAGIFLFEAGEAVCSSVFHVYMGGEWLVLLMTSSWDELCKFAFG